MSVSDKVGPKRTRLNFTEAVNDRFAFLKELGFSEAESLPTIVRYRKGDLEVDVYHGRQSFELGLGVARRGTRYTLSELIRVTDPVAADQYRNFAATTPKGIAEGISRLEKLAIRYGERALRGGDGEFPGTGKPLGGRTVVERSGRGRGKADSQEGVHHGSG